MYYCSLETYSDLLPSEFEEMGRLYDPERPNLEIKLIEIKSANTFLPRTFVIAPKSGFDVQLRSEEDVVYVYALPNLGYCPEGECSLKNMWDQGVLDWGAITQSADKARALQARCE